MNRLPTAFRRIWARIRRRPESAPFKLKNLAVGGNGLQPPWSYDDWGAIRLASYEGFGDELTDEAGQPAEPTA